MLRAACHIVHHAHSRGTGSRAKTNLETDYRGPQHTCRHTASHKWHSTGPMVGRVYPCRRYRVSLEKSMLGGGGKKGVLRGRGISWGETQKRTEGSQTLSEELFQFGEHGTVMPFAMSFCILACFPRRIDRERGKLYSLFRVRRGLQQSCK